MTAPALAVLTIALVSSIFGTASERTGDHGTTSVLNSILQNHKNMHYDLESTNMADHITSVQFVDIEDSIIDEVETKPPITQSYEQKRNLEIHRKHTEQLSKRKEVGVTRNGVQSFSKEIRYFDPLPHSSKVLRRSKRVKRQSNDDYCEPFIGNNQDGSHISHPKDSDSKSGLYKSGCNCNTTITAPENYLVQLTFVDVFHIEDHPTCANDYLEIRDGLFGYARLLAKLCGVAFPPQITSTGPHLWLKFHSDDTIEYDGFNIYVNFIQSSGSQSIHESCYKKLEGRHGVIDSATIDPVCRAKSSTLDVLWTITAPVGTKVYLNFTTYQLAKPNECEDNVVEVFGSVLEYPALEHYCGSVANSVTTKSGEAGQIDQSNIMHVRLFASKAARSSSFNATFTAYRTLDPNKEEKCGPDEFDCEDNTCIADDLKCNKYANCRLKADEDVELCKGATQSVISQLHIMVILIIFSLILSGMSFVFLFKCIRKLYQDHKIIKEHIRQSCEDRLDHLVSSRLTLDPTKLRRDSEPRASLERENHTNEMFKRQRNYSQHKPTSIDSDIHETQIDLDEEECRHYLKHSPIEEEVRIERNGRQRTQSQERREERREEKKGKREKEKEKEKREIRDVSVGAPDTKESGCQTRESLFQAGAPSSDESGSGSRGFSTFGYSGATLVRPSPPAATATSQITIELQKPYPAHQESLVSKKLPDRRPMSTETTRSAPDVIIVSKPVR